jgi:sec-independent protein translocase protein TatC
MGDKNNKKKDEMSFLEHLEELRWHLMRSAIAVIVMASLIFVFKDFVFDQIIFAPKNPDFITNKILCAFGNSINAPFLCINQIHLQIINVKMSGQFSMHLMVALIGGLILAFPYVFYQFWSFIKPGLHDNELKHARGAVFTSSSLFILGIMFGFFIIIPLSLNFFTTYSISDEVLNHITLNSYISTVTTTSLACGIIFELPVIIYLLAKIGLITASFMRKYRKHSIVVILVLSAIITPPDIFSQALVSIPLFALYEASIFVAAHIEKKKLKQQGNQ